MAKDHGSSVKNDKQYEGLRTMAAFRLDMPPPTLDLEVASGEPAVLA